MSHELAHIKNRDILISSIAATLIFIVNPFSGRSLMTLFSTHPSIEERITRLRALAGMREAT